MKHQELAPLDVAAPATQRPAAIDLAPTAMMASPLLRHKILRRAVQRRAERAAEPQAAFAQATSGGGAAVPFRGEMERSFGQDFSGVQAHVGRAPEMASLQAEAATVGDRVAFASASPSRELVAHELTHVVQQRQSGGPAGVAAKGEVSEPGEAAEVEADHVAARAAAGERVAVREAPTSGIHAKRPPGVYYRAGKPLTEGEGRALMERLVSGDKTALADLAGPADDGQEADAREWGLGLGTDEDEQPAAFIIPGGATGVVWKQFHGISPAQGGFTGFLAHSHPRVGRPGGGVKLSALLDPGTSLPGARMIILPSSDDLNFAATVGQEHTVYTPYIPVKNDNDYDVVDATGTTGTTAARLTFRLKGLGTAKFPAAFKGDPPKQQNTCILSAWCGDKKLAEVLVRTSERGKNPVMPIHSLPEEDSSGEDMPKRVEERHERKPHDERVVDEARDEGTLGVELVSTSKGEGKNARNAARNRNRGCTIL
jgi:hypothetical protein